MDAEGFGVLISSEARWTHLFSCFLRFETNRERNNRKMDKSKTRMFLEFRTVSSFQTLSICSVFTLPLHLIRPSGFPLLSLTQEPLSKESQLLPLHVFILPPSLPLLLPSFLAPSQSRIAATPAGLARIIDPTETPAALADA